MKKIKKILAVLSAITVLSAGIISAIPANADGYAVVSSDDTYPKILEGNEYYNFLIDHFEKISYEKLFLQATSINENTNGMCIKHIYKNKNSLSNYFIAETERTQNNKNGERIFEDISYDFDILVAENSLPENFSLDEMNDFLAKNGYMVKAGVPDTNDINSEFYCSNERAIKLTYDNKTTYEEQLKVIIALQNEYKDIIEFSPAKLPTTELMVYFKYVNGDANNDEKFNVRDAAHIAKMAALNKTGELPYTADYNKDSKIDVRDSAAIAKDLSSF